MATTEEHIAQSQHNFEVSRRLAQMQDWDWAVTALFYSAMHLVQAYLTRLDIEIHSHAQRERLMLRIPQLRPILPSYFLLKDESENARYECATFNRQEYETIRDSRYSSLVAHIRTLLGVA